MQNEFILRLISDEDFDDVFEIGMIPEINRYLNFEIMNKEVFKDIFNELKSSGQFFVYEYKRKVIATCIVMRQKRRANHVASLGTLATHSKFQSKGIGTKFMKDLFQKLKAEGIKRIDLCAEADNPVALNFYKKLGFELEGILKKYYKRSNEDHYIDEYLLALFFD